MILVPKIVTDFMSLCANIIIRVAESVPLNDSIKVGLKSVPVKKAPRMLLATATISACLGKPVYINNRIIMFESPIFIKGNGRGNSVSNT